MEYLTKKSWYWIIFKRAAPCARWLMVRRWLVAPLSCKIGWHRGFDPNDRGLSLGSGIVNYWCSRCHCVVWQQHISDSPQFVRKDFRDIQDRFSSR